MPDAITGPEFFRVINTKKVDSDFGKCCEGTIPAALTGKSKANTKTNNGECGKTVQTRVGTTLPSCRERRNYFQPLAHESTPRKVLFNKI